jgi:molybdopterin synthase catalytic subunit
MFRVSPSPLDPAELRRLLADPGAGACATFEGWVREQSVGRAVRALDYEAYLPLAEKEGERILAEAAGKFPILRAVCAHRTGALAVGDLAVWVGTAAPHRDAAFAASRYLIDELKARLPIWKREHYADGPSVWVNCATRGEAAALKHP